MNNKVLITGATGATGGHAVTALLGLGIAVRALVHKNDERSNALTDQGIEVVQGDLSDFDAVTSALKGVRGAYFVYPITVPGLLEATAYFAQAALEQEVQIVVNMSQISARREAKSHGALQHWIAERLFDRSGVPVAHLRPTFFAEWIAYQAQSIRKQNLLVLPFGRARYAPIAAEDQGRVIAHILTNPRDHIGKSYPLYGPKELDQFETTELLSEILDRKIVYEPMEIPAFGKLMSAKGYTQHFIQHITSVAQDCRDGVFSGTNNNVENITGQKPMSMEQYILKNKRLFMSQLVVNLS